MNSLATALAGLHSLDPARASSAALYPVLVLAGTLSPIPGVVRVSPRALASALHWRERSVRDSLAQLQLGELVLMDIDHELLWVPAAMRAQNLYSSREIAPWARHWAALPQCELRERIATDMLRMLAERGPMYAAAFAKHCLGRPAAPAPSSAAAPAKADAKKKPAAKAAELPAQWEAEFEELWPRYPKRAGNSTKKEAKTGFIARRRDDKMELAEIVAGVERYARYCEGMALVRTEMVMQAVRFFRSAATIREEFPLPAGHKIVLDLETSPDFERVLAAYPRQDGKTEAWSVWQRIEPAPTAALADQMIDSIAEWKKYQWPRGKEAFVLTFAKWLERLGWNRKFKQKGRSFEEIAALFGAAVGHETGNVYDGEAVACDAPGTGSVVPFPAPKQPSSNADPFDLAPIPARSSRL